MPSAQKRKHTEIDFFDSYEMDSFVAFAPNDILRYIYDLTTRTSITKKIVDSKYKHAMSRLSYINTDLDQAIEKGHHFIINGDAPPELNTTLRLIDMSGTWYAMEAVTTMKRARNRMDRFFNYDELIDKYKANIAAICDRVQDEILDVME